MAMFYYDEQCRRILLQFTRMFSNFSVEYGRAQETLTESPGHTLVRVPVRYGDASRQAQTIMQQNSASSMPSTPLMTFYISELSYDRPRVQEPYFVSSINVRQRKYVEATDSYTTQQGNAFTIDRPMPVPYKLTINLDIWTSNTNQKFQIWEQIAPLFNPALEIQSTDSFIDWTTITVVELISTKWSSKTIPVGTENPIDISTFTFEIPIWISPPVKVKKLGVVERVIASIYDAAGDINNAISNNDLLLGTRQVITPFDYQIAVTDFSVPNHTGRIQCLPYDVPLNPANSSLEQPGVVDGTGVFWNSITTMYGGIRPGISYIALEQWDESEVLCHVAPDPLDDRFLLITSTDNPPANTLAAVDAVIDPLLSGPGAGLPAPVVGTRYLFTEATGSDSGFAAAWAGLSSEPLIASANDVVEWTGTQWTVSFSASSSAHTIQYLTNITSDIQYRWTGEAWVKAVDGWYPPGTWRLVF